MKISHKILRFAILLVFMGSFCAFGSDTIKTSMKLTLNVVQPPQARTVNTASASYSSAKTQWVQAELKFDTADVKGVNQRFIDDIQLDVNIATYPGKSKNRCISFTGTVKYWTLEQDGKTHYMKALLPAQLFRRYAYGRQIEREVLVAKVVLKDKNKTLGTAYASTKTMQQRELYRFFRVLPRNTVKVPDSVFGRSGTSWSVIEVNKYELEKIK